MSILFNQHVFSSSGSEHFNIRKIQSQFSQRCSFHPSQVVFVVPPTHPFSSRTQISYSSILLLMGSFSIPFPSIFLSGDSQEDANEASSSSLFTHFPSPVDSIQASMLIISLPFVSHIFPCEFLIQASLIYSPLPVHIWSVEDILNTPDMNWES